MATIAPPAPPKPKDSTGGGGRSDSFDLGFGGEGGGSSGYNPFPLSRYRTGMWVALAPIIMLFTALTSAYVVRQGLGDDWRATALPSVLWWNSLLLLASSVTMEIARRKAKFVPGFESQVSGSGYHVPGRRSQVENPGLRVAGRRSQVESPGSQVAGRRLHVAIGGGRDELEAGARDLHLKLRKWLVATLLLGAGFLFGQIVAWRQLAARGIYLATNASSSFFYLLTATHALHLLGGIVGLACVTALTWKKLAPGGRTGVGVTAIYWHFMDGLWIYILLLLLILP